MPLRNKLIFVSLLSLLISSCSNNDPVTYTVSTSAGDNGAISASSATVNQGSDTSFTITPAANHMIDAVTGCGGSLSGNQYTTGTISAHCTVSATFKIITHTVSTSAGDNGAISVSSATVNQGSDTSFTVTPAANYLIDTVTGCGGSLSGNQYTTGTISADCTVSATFKIITHTVNTSAGANGAISASSATVNQASDTSFTITPATNYLIDTVTGCGGSLSGNQYTTGAINADCTVTATFKARLWLSDIAFTDDNLEQCVLDLGKQFVDELTQLQCTSRSITSSSGLEVLTALTDLDLRNNQLTEIDVSQNTALKDLIVGNNQLTEIDVTQNVRLVSLGAWSNQLTTVDVTQNTALEELALGNNQLTTLDVTQNAALIFLNLNVNQLTAIDVTQNAALTELSVGDNQLMETDVSQNAALDKISLFNNQLTAIDVTQNAVLAELSLADNQLSLIDLTQNTALRELNMYNNRLSSIDVSQNEALRQLYLGRNQLSLINVSQNTALTDLSLDNNQLSSIDVAQNTALTNLALNNNQLTVIDLSQNTALISLNLQGNQLTAVDLSNNPDISILSLDGDVNCTGISCIQ